MLDIRWPHVSKSVKWVYRLSRGILVVTWCCCISECQDTWTVIRGKFLAINAASMSCACPRSPKGLSPSAHLADGTTDLILVRKCSRLDFLSHLLRHTNKDDQVPALSQQKTSVDLTWYFLMKVMKQFHSCFIKGWGKNTTFLTSTLQKSIPAVHQMLTLYFILV